MPWVLWLQQLASFGQAEDLFSNALTLVSTQETSSFATLSSDDISALSMLIETPSSTTVPPNDVDALALMAYTPSSGSIPLNDAEVLAWMSF
jgi:hypothetical protein